MTDPHQAHDPESLASLEQQLHQRQQEMEDRLWMDASLNKIDDILRLNYDKSLAEFADTVIFHVSKLVNALRGAFFVVEEDEIHISGGYACRPDSFVKSSFKSGEGLIGQSIKTREFIYLDDIPAQNAVVESGLAQVSSSCVAIIPLLFNDKAYGVMELTTLQRIPEVHRRLLERLSKNIASTLQSIQNNLHTKALLLEAQGLTESMRAQEEELRQNLEELEISQEHMGLQQRQLQQKESQLHSFLNSTMDGMMMISTDLVIQILNSKFNQRFSSQGLYVEPGKTNIRELFNDHDWQGFWGELQYALKGELRIFEHDYVLNGQTTHFQSSFSPIFDQDGHTVVAIAAIGRDITDSHRLMQEVKQKNQTLEVQHQDMQRNEQRMRSFLDSSTDVMLLVDKELRILLVNKFFVEGYAQMGVHIKEGETNLRAIYSDEQNWQQIQDGIQRCMQGENHSFSYVYHANFQGQELNVHVRNTLSPVRDPATGEVIAVTIISHNYTEMQQVMDELQQKNEEQASIEEELRQNLEQLNASQEQLRKRHQEVSIKEAQMRAFIDSTEDGMILVGRDLRILLGNRIFCQRLQGFGIEFGKTSIHDLFPVEEAWKPFETLLLAALNGTEGEYEHPYPIEGRMAWFQSKFVPVLNDQKEVFAVSIISSDITLQHELRQREAQLQAFMDSSVDSMLLLDTELKLQVANRIFLNRITGDRDNALGTPLSQLLPESEWKSLEGHLQRALQGIPGTQEIAIPQNEHTLWLEQIINPVLDTQGHVNGISIIRRNITALKQLEAAAEVSPSPQGKKKPSLKP